MKSRHNQTQGPVNLRACRPFVIAMALWLGCSAGLFGQAVPDRINYQGILLKGDGTPVPAMPTDVEFRIYDTPAAATGLQWGRMFRVTPDTNGLFNVVLSGEGALLTGAPDVSLASVFSGVGSDSRYLELTVAGSTPIRPRQRFVASPYAFLAHDVTDARHDFAVAGLLKVGGTAGVGSLNATGTATASNFVGNGTIPIGGIIMWSGSETNVPPGWALCDGTQGTPDLRGRFVLASGAGTGLTARTGGQTGGKETVGLTANQMPGHAHYYRSDKTSVVLLGGRSGELIDSSDGGGFALYGPLTTASQTESTGSGEAHENMPPYYVLAFIMRVQ